MRRGDDKADAFALIATAGVLLVAVALVAMLIMAPVQTRPDRARPDDDRAMGVKHMISLVLPIAGALLLGGLWRIYPRRRGPMRCRGCGYNLTGNVSGRCPECGTKMHLIDDCWPRK